jgi:hypothetical protein
MRASAARAAQSALDYSALGDNASRTACAYRPRVALFSLSDFRSHNGVALGVKPKLRSSLESCRVDLARGLSCVYESLVSFAEKPNQNRDRSAYIAQYLRNRKPHKIDTRPNPCHRLRSDSLRCICACHLCAGTSDWLAECHSRVLDTGCKT